MSIQSHSSNPALITRQSIQDRVATAFLASRLIDNNLRGYWCEAMVAEALGDQCSIVSTGWHPWDLQVGPDQAEYPERIRIQVKNSARLQTWSAATGKLSDPEFKLRYARKPSYFDTYSSNVPCEQIGFLCDVFVLCYHPVESALDADQTDPRQWRFYVLPVRGPHCAVTSNELAVLEKSVARTGRPATTHRRPVTLEEGIRGRPPVPRRVIEDLSVDLLRSLLD